MTPRNASASRRSYVVPGEDLARLSGITGQLDLGTRRRCLETLQGHGLYERGRDGVFAELLLLQ